MSPDVLGYVLGVRVEEVPHHLVTLPAWDSRPTKDEPHGRPCVRVTALARRRVLRAAVFEAPTEADALARLCAEGVA